MQDPIRHVRCVKTITTALPGERRAKHDRFDETRRSYSQAADTRAKPLPIKRLTIQLPNRIQHWKRQWRRVKETPYDRKFSSAPTTASRFDHASREAASASIEGASIFRTRLYDQWCIPSNRDSASRSGLVCIHSPTAVESGAACPGDSEPRAELGVHSLVERRLATLSGLVRGV